MPIFPKLFKRHRTTSVIDDTTHARGPSSYNFAQSPDSHLSLPLPVPDLRRGISLPVLVVPQNGSDTFSAGLDVYTNGNHTAGNDYLQVADSKMLPPTPSSPTSPARSEVADGMAEMWRGIDGRDANMSKSERIVNKISDAASGAVNAGSSSDGVLGLVKSVIANEEVQAFGKTILEGVPAIMSALETLTEVHPFLKAAYLPFKLIYHQETQRRENDQKRTTLFEKIKDVMLVLLELKGFGKDDTRSTPEGKPVLSRLASICKDMKKDIEECYNVLNAQDKRGVGIKFLKASSWNKELGSYAARFKSRREDLTFALSMRGVVTMEEMNSNMKMMMEMFSTMMSPQERDMGRWISQNGGEKAVLGSDKKCAAMIKYEATLATATGPAGRAEKGKASDDETVSKKAEAKAIAALRKEYREDISGIIQENLESYSKRFEMGLDDLGKDLGKKIQHQGDRLINYLKGGPHSRIKDKMVYHVWKDQGWRGSAKTRPLVLAIRDYFVERVEHSKLPPPQEVVRKRPVSTVPAEENDNDDDPETDMSVPLPDEWMTAYLQVKRLRYLQQAFDADSSGFTTISEINAFTHARPEDWSLPRWISYWAIGWQIFATKYCIEIEELFAQMFLLKKEIGIQMPGNKRYINDYLDGCWQHVTALTSAIERYDSPPPWLEDKFADYVQSQEKILKERLEKIQYDIDALETVALLLRGDRIEQSIFPLLVLLMRRHVEKMHLCLKQEIDSRELYDDQDTVTWVVAAVWSRFVELKELFQHQQVPDLKQSFEQLSCGLFKNYWEWQDWVKNRHFMDSDMTAWSSVDEIHDLKPSPGILAYVEGKAEPVQASEEDSSSDTTPTAASSPGIVAPTVEALATDQMSVMPSSPVVSKPPSAAETSITGIWYGWHWTEIQKPYLGMTCLNIQCGGREAESETEISISGNGVSYSLVPFTLFGTMNSVDQPQGSLVIDFQRIYSDDGTWIQYHGTFLYDREVLTGTFERAIANGSFLFKKVPESYILCSRPFAPELNTKELWSFAYKAVVDKIRRQKPGLSYLCKRMTQMRRIVEFTYRDNMELLSDAEQAEYSEVQRLFSVEEMTELFKLYLWYDRAVDLQPRNYTCDSCGDAIQRSRVVCLDCVSEEGPERTIDFCSKIDCIASATPQRTDVTHLPSHLMMKTRDFFLLKDYFTFKQRAGYSLSYARDVYKDPTDDLSLAVPLPASPTEPEALDIAMIDAQSFLTVLTNIAPIGERKSQIQPSLTPLNTMIAPPIVDPAAENSPDTASSGTTRLLSIPDTPVENGPGTFDCNICHERVVTPGWYCMDCYDSWICDSCEKIIDGLDPWDFIKRYRSEVSDKEQSNAHNVFHLLVRVARTSGEEAKPVEGDNTDAAEGVAISSPLGWEQVEKRIQELVTARFEAVNAHVDKRLEEVETRLTNGFANIERLLTMLTAGQ
ncbi:hypothetical protein C8R43DRAFT_996337 [Mycena crocata]|nr:hypothetical protein C8R43DRAFT_996337 [Mycena crocata]